MKFLAWLGVQSVLSNNPTKHFIQYTGLRLKNIEKGGWDCLWFFVIWHIWTLRNNIVFNGAQITIDDTLDQIKANSWRWLKTCRLSRFADEIAREEKAQVFAIRIDCSESRSIREAFEGVLSLGFVEVLVYNAWQPISWRPTSFSDIRVDHFEKSLSVSCGGAFHCAQQVLPGMVDRGRGTILFTGCSASVTGIAGYSDLCCGKFALRALSQCLSRELQPVGVHVAHVIIDGIIGAPRVINNVASTSHQRSSSSSVGDQQHESGCGIEGLMDPDALAQTYWQLHIQDRSVWTQEIDLRPGGPRLS